MIDIDGANAYLTEQNHMLGRTWKKAGADQRQASIAYAMRTIERLVGDDFDDETSDTDDFPRYDLAVYEQAVWLLQHSEAIQNGEIASEKIVATKVSSKAGAPRPIDVNGICPAALFWLVKKIGAVRLSRG